MLKGVTGVRLPRGERGEEAYKTYLFFLLLLVIIHQRRRRLIRLQKVRQQELRVPSTSGL